MTHRKNITCNVALLDECVKFTLQKIITIVAKLVELVNVMHQFHSKLRSDLYHSTQMELIIHLTNTLGISQETTIVQFLLRNLYHLQYCWMEIQFLYSRCNTMMHCYLVLTSYTLETMRYISHEILYSKCNMWLSGHGSRCSWHIYSIIHSHLESISTSHQWHVKIWL